MYIYIYIYPDSFEINERSMIFYHRMRKKVDFFSRMILQQKLTPIKDKLYDPEIRKKDIVSGNGR